MSKKISLYINGRSFDVGVDDEFGRFLSSEMDKDFNTDGNNDTLVLLQAYIRKNQKLFEQNKEIEKLLKKFDDLDDI